MATQRLFKYSFEWPLFVCKMNPIRICSSNCLRGHVPILNSSLGIIQGAGTGYFLVVRIWIGCKELSHNLTPWCIVRCHVSFDQVSCRLHWFYISVETAADLIISYHSISVELNHHGNTPMSANIPVEVTSRTMSSYSSQSFAKTSVLDISW